MVGAYQDIMALEQSPEPDAEVESTYALIAQKYL